MKTLQSPFDLELLNTKRDWVLFLCLIIFIFICSISYEFYKYKSFIEEKNVNFNAQVLLQYKKANYFVLKLKSNNGEIFYTISRDDLKDLRNRFVNIYGILGKDCSFFQYLKSCFVVSFNISLLKKRDYRNWIMDYIDSQHSDKYFYNSKDFEVNILGSLYKNLFLATPMESRLREVSATLGIAHIFAISGFHLGILSLFLYGILAVIYRIFQRKYWTYRNEFYDLNFIILIFAFLYLVILDFSPSFLRSFVMFAFGILVLYSGVKLLSFRLLLSCTLIILSLFPKIFFSIGFWLSISGVFYIYLFLRHFPKINKWLYMLNLNFIVFLNMLVISHYFFYTFSLYQLLSPFLTILFVIFYPFVLILHIIGFGGILDSLFFRVINYDFFSVELQTSFWLLLIFLFSSFFAIFYKKAYHATILLSILYFLYGILLT